MPISSFQYQQMIERMAGSKRREALPEDGATREVEEIHEPIIQWCRNQVPMIPYINPRSDKRSTISVGAPDFVIFYKGRVLLIECKTRTGKVSPAQLGWHLCAEYQGFKVNVVRSINEFHELINNLPDAPSIVRYLDGNQNPAVPESCGNQDGGHGHCTDHLADPDTSAR